MTPEEVQARFNDFQNQLDDLTYRLSRKTGLGSADIKGNIVAGSVALKTLDVANKGWTQTCAFSVFSASIVIWGSGTFTTADGVVYAISAGTTGTMTAKTYIYLDTNVSLTAYQTTTTASTAVGPGKVLLAIAQNGTGEATFMVLDGQGGINIDASSIVANSITANELAASLIYAGSIQIDTAGNIRSGQTDFNTGTGWFLGNSAGTPKFSIGSTSNYLTWDGTYVRIKGNLDLSSPFNNISYTVANLPVPPSSLGFNSPSGNE